MKHMVHIKLRDYCIPSRLNKQSLVRTFVMYFGFTKVVIGANVAYIKRNIISMVRSLHLDINGEVSMTHH